MHEESETIEEDGKFINIYGPGKHRTGRLPGSGVYDTLHEAEHAAEERSRLHTEPDKLIHGPQLPQGLNMDQLGTIKSGLQALDMGRMSNAGFDVQAHHSRLLTTGPYAEANKRQSIWNDLAKKRTEQ